MYCLGPPWPEAGAAMATRIEPLALACCRQLLVIPGILDSVVILTVRNYLEWFLLWVDYLGRYLFICEQQ